MKERGVPVDFNYKLEGKKLFLYGLSPAYINGVTRSHPQNDINVRELVCSTVDIEPEIPDRKSVCDYVVISDRTSSLQALMAEVETHCRRGKNYQPNNFRLNNRTLKLNHIVGFDMEEAIGGYGGCVIAKSNCRYV
ncbi:MAG: hypothetical protein JW754_02015 [Candidatus Aenigmarchaeota archaeon]|nr:hypothetical protein [Candidatus Aenigmarchaeota archaeon]